MKNTFKKLLVLFIGLFAFVINTKAMTLDEAVTAVTGSTIKYDMTDKSRSEYARWEIAEQISNLFKSYTNENSYAMLVNCTSTQCEMDFTYYDEATESYTNKTGIVPIQYYGVFLEQESYAVTSGGEITVKYKNLDVNLNAKPISVTSITGGYDAEEGSFVINGDKIKINKPGVYEFEIDFEYGEGQIDYKYFVVLCDVQSLINSKLSGLTSFTSDVSYNNYQGDMLSSEENLVNKVIGEFGNFTIDSRSTCVSADACESTLKYNFDFDVNILGYTYYFKANNVTVNKVGFMYEDGFYAKKFTKNEVYQVDFTSFSNNLTWSSSDTSVATVDQDGKVTGKSDGAAVIIIDYGAEYTRRVPILVRTEEDTIVKNLQSTLTSKLNGRTKLSVPVLSTLQDWLKEEAIDDAAYEIFREKLPASGGYAIVKTDISDDFKKVTISLGYDYDWPSDQPEYLDSVTYCRLDEIFDQGYDCGVEATLDIEFADEVPGFDPNMVDRASALLNGIDYDEYYPSYIDENLNDYLDYTDIEDSYRAAINAFIDGANLTNLIPNIDGFELRADLKGAMFDYAPAEIFVSGNVVKDEIIYATTNNTLQIKRVLRIPRPSDTSDAAVITAITNTVKGIINNNNINVDVTKDKGATFKIVLSGAKELEVITYIEYEDGTPAITVIPSLNIAGITKPYGGQKPTTSSIMFNTSGVGVKSARWIHESNGEGLLDDETFVTGQKYVLVIEVEPESGYAVTSGLGESNITANVPFLMGEYIHGSSEVRLYYEAVNPTLTAPKATITSSNSAATITWDDQYGVTKAEVYRSTSKTKGYKKVATVTTNIYTNTGLTYGKTYYYKVRVYNGTKWSSYSNIVSKKIVPNKVANLRITSVGPNNIKVSWDKIGVSGYQLQRSTNNKKWSTIKTITKNSTLNYNNTKLSVNKTYYYRVRAYKKVGSKKVYGAWSTVLVAKTTPAKPTLKLSMKDFREVNITIGKASGATLYVLERSLDGTNYTLYDELTAAATVVNTELDTGSRYYYRVKGCNGDLCSPWVSTSIVSSTKTPSLTLKTSSKKVTVTVSRVNGATGYEIYRATKKTGKYTKVKTILDEEELLQYINSTSKGKTYYYKVRSYVELESMKVYSSYSSIKSIRSK